MGVTIKIGDLKIIPKDDDPEDEYIRFMVDQLTHEGHPNYPAIMARRNKHDFTYGDWSSFLSSVGLSDVFMNDSVYFKGGHPGGLKITQMILDRIDQALANLKADNPDYVLRAVLSSNDLDIEFHALTWLHYWCHYAFDNAPYPVIING